MDQSLRQRFDGVWTRAVGGSGAEAAWRALDAGYGEAARHYHGWPHVRALLAGHDAVRGLPDVSGLDGDAIDLAIYFHDAVYDPARSDNEARSADLLVTCSGSGLGRECIRSAVAMIRATAAHGPSEDPETRLMLDLDLAVLGAPRAIYEAYAAAVRREYAMVPDAAWRIGRAGVLDRFLDRPRLYQTGHFHDRLESAARANLADEAAALRAGG
ncbi:MULTISPECIES: hypothetical protein [unclassified Methylobacterium]|uniref:HD domain-containing protein n=1 Tax=unclassified Methylobacterium TaxID=2615210 RepID=UPI0007015639|nr:MULTISPECIES: hypothetical protein [unclassified Methylobacterium]KQO49346.1 hypothetical protein ASF24_09360 [Methylobacterium sp. Leaf86]KQP00425.1 hypothetical protein ASF32_00595 [Methylobacterium sp. Leaf91]